jgi:phosphatidylserine decarboxylase
MLRIMAILERPPAAQPIPAPPTSVQPGGHSIATCLEVAWGRLRRGFLRRFRPGHVRLMAEKRQGQCANCAHDVIDSRDLKFCRNVCGFHFGPDDDPYRRPGLLPLARAGLAEVVFYSALLLGVAAGLTVLGAWVNWGFFLGSAAAIGFWIFIVSFFRDPERAIPADKDALLSPADGTVIGVGEIEEPDFPGGRAFRVSIFLSPFNVHVNRAPRAGNVVALRYFKGCFVPATRGDCDRVNEQFWLDLKEPGGRLLRIKQVAGAVARRIVCWARLNEELKAGDRYGMIKLGSRTDVLMPVGEATEVLVKAGDAVKGGVTVLLRLRPAS